MMEIRLPFYGGANEDNLSCQQFLFIVEEMAKRNFWSDEEKFQMISQQCFFDEALNWLGTCQCQTFSDLRRQMLARRKVSAINLEEKVKLKENLVQKEDENVQEFYNRCKNVQAQLCDHFYSDLLNERELLLNFACGLRQEIKDIIFKSEDDTRNLEAFLEAAIKVENVQASLNSELEQSVFDELLDDIIEEDDFSDIIKEEDEEVANPSYTCEKCPSSFASKKLKLEHTKEFHPESCHACHLCPQSFVSGAKLSAHFSTKHPEKEREDDDTKNSKEEDFRCNFCTKEYSNKNSLKAHIHTKHVNAGKSFSCQVCPKKFTSSSNLKTHVRIVHLMERPYECDTCGKCYASEGGLSAHQASIHGRGERLQCDKCDMSFPYKSALTTHILNRHNRGTFICDECGAANNTKEALRVHKITDHSEDKGKKLPCPYAPECKEKFRVPFQVRNHVKRVHKKVEGTHACTLCPKKYHSRQRLESHVNGVHLNKKPHKCPHCDFASAYNGHVKDHIRASHEAVKYPCPYPMCNHQSSYKGNLDKHIRNIHNKSKI